MKGKVDGSGEEGSYTWAINLHTVIEETGELDHLYQLVHKRSSKMEYGGEPEEKMAAVLVDQIINPILDDLEEYLRSAMHPGMSHKEIKQIVHTWIEEQCCL